MNYRPKYFRIEELIPPEVFEYYNSRPGYDPFWLFDPGILKAADCIRKDYGRLVCNTWYWGGHHCYRGFRPSGCIIGADYSQHRFGRALDLVPVDTPLDDIRSDIIRGNVLGGDFITAVEINVGWLHIDNRNHKGLLLIRP